MISKICSKSLFRTISYRNHLQLKVCLNKQYPEVFSYLHPIWQEEYKDASIPVNSLLLWKCPHGPDHEWKSSPQKVIKRYNISKFHNPCPFCSSQLVSETNSLFYRYPYIADEWDEEINIEHSEMITYGTTSQFAWNCRFHEDHHYIQSANRRTDLNMLCPYCAREHSTSDNLASQFPEIAKEWDHEKNDLQPNEFSSHSKRIVHWKCSHNHQWTDRINNRTYHHTCCPVCKCNEQVSLSTRLPSLCSYWDYQKNALLSPDSISIGNRKRVYWKCSQCQQSFSCIVSQMVTTYIDKGECLCANCLERLNHE